jgi:hypothetical protein
MPDAQVALTLFEVSLNRTSSANKRILFTDVQGYVQTTASLTEWHSGTEIVVQATVTYGSLMTTAPSFSAFRMELHS